MLDHHQVYEEYQEDDEEGNVEQSILHQRSQQLLPDAEVASQDVRLTKRKNNPRGRKGVGGGGRLSVIYKDIQCIIQMS